MLSSLTSAVLEHSGGVALCDDSRKERRVLDKHDCLWALITTFLEVNQVSKGKFSVGQGRRSGSDWWHSPRSKTIPWVAMQSDARSAKWPLWVASDTAFEQNLNVSEQLKWLKVTADSWVTPFLGQLWGLVSKGVRIAYKGSTLKEPFCGLWKWTRQHLKTESNSENRLTSLSWTSTYFHTEYQLICKSRESRPYSWRADPAFLCIWCWCT